MDSPPSSVAYSGTWKNIHGIDKWVDKWTDGQADGW